VDDDLTKGPARVALRPATEDDREFLADVYASTRTEELSVLDWPEEQKHSFLRMQFDAQDAYYREVYPKALLQVITTDGRAIGRLYTVRLADEIRLIDIALLPAYRGGGIGSKLVKDVTEDARRSGLAVRLHVEPWNPAKRLYEGFGFRVVSAGPVYELMELDVVRQAPPIS
jgi:ribosomal protein S18 acetylase RimI-like enzyme